MFKFQLQKISILLLLFIIGCASFTTTTNPNLFENKSSVDISELEKKQTIMHFAGEDDQDGLFFSRVISVENYKNGDKHGVWIYYNEDGTIDKIEKYFHGKLIE